MVKSNSFVSVIVPTKNSSQFLDECLLSIKNQTYSNIELIVVDNFSTDNTETIARKYTENCFQIGPERCTQRNHGAFKATGEYIVFIDSDMKLSPRVIESCTESMKNNNFKGVIIPEESFGEGFWAQCKKLERSFYVGVDAIEAARFFRLSDFKSVGGYNEQLVSGEDWDLSDRIELLGAHTRISDYICHNEGRLSLYKTLQKKYYYAQKASAYLTQTNTITAAMKRRQGVLGRYLLFFKRPFKLFRNPLFGFGMLVMKTGEFMFGLAGYLQTKKYGHEHTAPATLETIQDADYPFVSYIIPTFNAEKYLRRCLDSIITQDYPQNKYEILVADGGSTDATLDILRDFNIIPIPNPKRIAEYGKYLAYDLARGDILCLLDSDNIIASKDWLKKMVTPLLKEPTLMGVESNYLFAPDFTSINTYANLLVIVDPLARILASKPAEVELRNGYLIKSFKQGSVPVSGANGFLWRKNIVKEHIDTKNKIFEEVNLMSLITQRNPIIYANIPGTGIYHYYCSSLADYMQKRRKIARKFLARKKARQVTWVDRNNAFLLPLASLYLITIIGPLLEATWNIIRTLRIEWLWHPIVSFQTIFIYILSFMSKETLSVKK